MGFSMNDEEMEPSKPSILTLEEIVHTFHVHPQTAQILLQRGLNTQKSLTEYLLAGFHDLHHPTKIPGIKEMASGIKDKLLPGLPAAIFCDYDVDGLCGAVILQQALSVLPGSTPFIFPSQRDRDGYGLSVTAIQELVQQNVQLLITVDCGITDNQALTLAMEQGMDVFIIDHHESTDTPPVPFLDLKVQPGEYPFTQLCAAAVAWKLAQVLLQDPLREYLDLVALATIADVVDLIGENRILVQEGLKKMMDGDVNPGLYEILRLKGLEKEALKTHHIGYQIAPLLNASGRLGSPQKALDLLLVDSPTTRRLLAVELLETNEERRALTREAVQEAVEGIDPHHMVLIYQGKIPAGITGLVAGELRERYRKAVIIIGEGGRGSGRSMAPLNMYQLLKDCQEFLTSFGGHRMAAGLTLKDGAYSPFTHKIQQLTAAISYLEQTIDLEIDPAQLKSSFFTDLERLEPYGSGNLRPILFSQGVKANGIRILQGGHLFFYSCGLEFIGYDMKEKVPLCRRGLVDLIYHAPSSKGGPLILKDLSPSSIL